MFWLEITSFPVWCIGKFNFEKGGDSLYKNVKSEFIKNLIKERGLKGKGGRGYIHDLLRLEEYILNGPRGFASGMHYHILKGKYRREWEAIYRELKPKEFEEIMQREREEERKRKQEKERRRREEIIRQLKKEWLEKNAGTNLPPDAFGWEFVDFLERIAKKEMALVD